MIAFRLKWGAAFFRIVVVAGGGGGAVAGVGIAAGVGIVCVVDGGGVGGAAAGVGIDAGKGIDGVILFFIRCLCPRANLPAWKAWFDLNCDQSGMIMSHLGHPNLSPLSW